jgi:hypothetical protein
MMETAIAIHARADMQLKVYYGLGVDGS